MIDKRVIERQIRKGKLDAAAYQRSLEALPDVSDRVARDTDIEPPSRPAASSGVASAAATSGVHAPVAEASPEADDLDDDEVDDEDEDDEDGEAQAADDAGDAPAST